ncbi:GmrSD restriction endonuclease domain-containing protein [Nocardioides perillae]|uniref:GmrSD restriction endonucleases N-terminal domain-containing protein n=1 Tax=Nocardioides perillae TaxID=1119534 RepID=A0A7Y9RTZ1_9ACTN|nr:hypothetical protein [Nocardioides perillae]
MKGHQTTYLGLFDEPKGDRPRITGIEIPIIQRDYAQGRADDETTAIRRRFARMLVRAAYGAAGVPQGGVGLDFVYGGVHVRKRDAHEHHLLEPLDGQQRLTTLFLLHWYVASRAGVLDRDAEWLQFSYATRPSARYFAAALREHPLPNEAGMPSAWITDQPWYLYPWQDDPTIASMLVMLDAIHDAALEIAATAEADAAVAWARLRDRAAPKIWFHFLPVADLGRGEDLYLKMNSRGKALTKFEVFKADLEDALTSVLAPTQHQHVIRNFDGAWTDLFWEYEKASRKAAAAAEEAGVRPPPKVTVDGAFMRYIGFLIEVCEWRDRETGRRWSDKEQQHERTLEERARLALVGRGTDDQRAASNRDFFLHAFDTWCQKGEHPTAVFDQLFRVGDVGTGPLPLLVSAAPDLVGICVSSENGLTLPEMLLLYAVLLARQPGREPSKSDLHRRLRTLRNLVESAVIQRKRMPDYLPTVESLVVDGVLDEKQQSFNADWAADQVRVWGLIDQSSAEVRDAVHGLEDHSMVRGRLLSFDLDAATLPRRAATFALVAVPELRDLFGAALLTYGDYSRDVGWESRKRQLGSSELEESWREILTIGSRESMTRVRGPLMELLDDVEARLTAGPTSARDVLTKISLDWCAERESRSHFDWRYYLVRYPGARSKVGQGFYHGEYDAADGGFGYAGLHILHGSHYSAYFSDALLLAAWTDGGLSDVASKPQWYRVNTGMAVRQATVKCAEDGFSVQVPDDADAEIRAAVARVREVYRTSDDGRVLVKQRRSGAGRPIDSEDRVQLCIRLVRDLAGQQPDHATRR